VVIIYCSKLDIVTSHFFIYQINSAQVRSPAKTLLMIRLCCSMRRSYGVSGRNEDDEIVTTNEGRPARVYTELCLSNASRIFTNGRAAYERSAC
jgi:hypothetical protein